MKMPVSGTALFKEDFYFFFTSLPWGYIFLNQIVCHIITVLKLRKQKEGIVFALLSIKFNNCIN